jgi:hypothetical protein
MLSRQVLLALLSKGITLTPLFADEADTLTAGFAEANDDDGTQSSGTYTPVHSTGAVKVIVNGGAFTLAAPSPATDTTIYGTILIVNNGSAGAITLSGWDVENGDDFDTTDTNAFVATWRVIDDGGTTYASVTVEAQQ